MRKSLWPEWVTAKVLRAAKGSTQKATPVVLEVRHTLDCPSLPAPQRFAHTRAYGAGTLPRELVVPVGKSNVRRETSRFSRAVLVQ